MEAFHKHIDALEQRIELLIQKWHTALNENNELNERNRELEEKLTNKISDRKTDTDTDNISKLNNIEKTLDGYIDQIEQCIELINIELDGK